MGPLVSFPSTSYQVVLYGQQNKAAIIVTLLQFISRSPYSVFLTSLSPGEAMLGAFLGRSTHTEEVKPPANGHASERGRASILQLQWSLQVTTVPSDSMIATA